MADAGGPAWDEQSFARLRDRVRAELNETMLEVVTGLRRILTIANTVQTRLSGMGGAVLGPSLADISSQLSALVYRGFVTATGYQRLPDVVRYLQAVERRLEKLPERPDRDREWARDVQAVEEEYRQLAKTVPESEKLTGIRWMIEELRVSYFAQTLKTAYPISAKRIFKAMDELGGA